MSLKLKQKTTKIQIINVNVPKDRICESNSMELEAQEVCLNRASYEDRTKLNVSHIGGRITPTVVQLKCD